MDTNRPDYTHVAINKGIIHESNDWGVYLLSSQNQLLFLSIALVFEKIGLPIPFQARLIENVRSFQDKF